MTYRHFRKIYNASNYMFYTVLGKVLNEVIAAYFKALLLL